MTLPRILVIDDQFADEADTRTKFCSEKGLVPIDFTTSDEVLKRECDARGCQAGAVFTSAQAQHGDYVENSLDEALKAVESGWPHKTGWRWSLILLDKHFASSPPQPDDEVFGLRILDALVRKWPDREAQAGNSELPLVMLSSIPDAAQKRLANRAGVRAYVDKELDKEDPLTHSRLDQLLNEYGLIGDRSGLLIGQSYSFLKVLREARRVARMKAGNAMILGPAGTGKTALAKYIHRQSSRKGKFRDYTFQPNVEELAHSDFFGYWKGTFTGALPKPRRGIAEEAHEGILFIDEVHSLTWNAQNEFLKFAEPESDGLRLVRRSGSFPNSKEARDSVLGHLRENGDIHVDLILIAATNEPLDDPEWRNNRFRYDLYSRLATKYQDKPLRYPSLDERKDDIPLLFDHFLNQETIKERWRRNSDGTKSVDPEVYDELRERSWPGNIRDLSGVARAVALNAKDFPDVFLRHLPTASKIPPMPVPKREGEDLPVIDKPRAKQEIGLSELAELMKSANIPHSPTELEGKLALLENAYGELVRNILEVALRECKKSGKGFVTPALKLLLPDEIKKPYQANRKLEKLSKLFEAVPGSLLEAVLNNLKGDTPQDETVQGGKD